MAQRLAATAALMQNGLSVPSAPPPQQPTPPLFINRSAGQTQQPHGGLQLPEPFDAGKVPPLFHNGSSSSFGSSGSQTFNDVRGIVANGPAKLPQMKDWGFSIPFVWPPGGFQHHWLLGKSDQTGAPPVGGAKSLHWDPLCMSTGFGVDACYPPWFGALHTQQAMRVSTPPELPTRAAHKERTNLESMDARSQKPPRGEPGHSRVHHDGQLSTVGSKVFWL